MQSHFQWDFNGTGAAYSQVHGEGEHMTIAMKGKQTKIKVNGDLPE